MGEAPSGSWVCMDCGNEATFQVVYYDTCQLTQQNGRAEFSGAPAQPQIDDNRILQMGCGACQSLRVGMKFPDSDQVVPGRWVEAAARHAPPEPVSQEDLDDVAPSLGVPESKGADGSLQWDVENPIAGTRVLVAYNPESRTASVYVRSGNAFIGYTALDSVAAVLSDLDEGEVEFIGRQGLNLAVTADGVFFVRSANHKEATP